MGNGFHLLPSDRGLISKIYKAFNRLDINKPNRSIKKRGTDRNRKKQEESQIAEKHLKKCSTFLPIRAI